MKRSFTIVAAAIMLGFVIAALPTTAPSAQAAGCVQIYRIYFDSPGSDNGSNRSLNAEWIQLHNKCSSAKSLAGWTVRDASSHVYHLGTYTLKAGGYVKIHTGRGTNSSTNRYWASRYYIWNNNGDTAKLKNGSGTLVDKCHYSGAGSSVSC